MKNRTIALVSVLILLITNIFSVNNCCYVRAGDATEVRSIIFENNILTPGVGCKITAEVYSEAKASEMTLYFYHTKYKEITLSINLECSDSEIIRTREFIEVFYVQGRELNGTYKLYGIKVYDPYHNLILSRDATGYEGIQFTIEDSKNGDGFVAPMLKKVSFDKTEAYLNDSIMAYFDYAESDMGALNSVYVQKYDCEEEIVNQNVRKV